MSEIDDLKEEFVRDFVVPMFRANARYEGVYLLGTSSARPLIAKRLVEIARNAANHYGADRATFVQSDIDAFSFEGFSGIYLYNPFYEQISNVVRQIDGTTERSWTAYRHFVDTTTAKLAALAPPVVVVTFDGFGGPMPAAYALKEVESAWYDRLELWIKV